MSGCRHLQLVQEDVEPSANGCEDCLKIGNSWVHLLFALFVVMQDVVTRQRLNMQLNISIQYSTQLFNLLNLMRIGNGVMYQLACPWPFSLNEYMRHESLQCCYFPAGCPSVINASPGESHNSSPCSKHLNSSSFNCAKSETWRRVLFSIAFFSSPICHRTLLRY